MNEEEIEAKAHVALSNIKDLSEIVGHLKLAASNARNALSEKRIQRREVWDRLHADQGTPCPWCGKPCVVDDDEDLIKADAPSREEIERLKVAHDDLVKQEEVARSKNDRLWRLLDLMREALQLIDRAKEDKGL